MICFDKHNHHSGVLLKVQYRHETTTFSVGWEGTVTEELRRAYRDQNRATDFAACAIALLLVPELTPFTAIEQSSVGTTVDYYLVPKDQDDT
jgi:hypothetical protein